MKCPECGGDGWVQDFCDVGWQCDKCGGKGVVEPMTNKEYLRTCTTEQLTEAILQHWIDGAYHGVGEFGLTDKEIELSREDIVDWLKQPHTPKE